MTKEEASVLKSIVDELKSKANDIETAKRLGRRIYPDLSELISYLEKMA